MKEAIRRSITIGILIALSFCLEKILAPIPNVTLTFFLFILYSKKLKFVDTLIIISIHCLLIELFSGYFNFIFLLAMIVGYSFIPIIIGLFKTEKPIYLSLVSIPMVLLYAISFAVTSCVMYNLDFWEYMLYDITFDLILIGVTFIEVLILYRPLSKVMDKYIKDQE